jgi:hypothetical protein
MNPWSIFLSFITLLVFARAQGNGNDDDDGGDAPYPGVPAPPYSPAQFMNVGMLNA